MRFLRLSVAFSIIITFVTVCSGQQSPVRQVNGQLRINLRDLCGEVIKKAKITIIGNFKERKFKSNKLGQLELSLPLGKYEIKVEKYSFKVYRVINVEVSADTLEVVNITMEEGYASDDPKAPATWKCPPAKNTKET